MSFLYFLGWMAGGAPHFYFYCSYSYRQWTPWEKVELDIQSDYLVPAVVNRRVFLFWPVFTEGPDDDANKSVSTPAASTSNVLLPETSKRLKLQMAVSEYRQGKRATKK